MHLREMGREDGELINLAQDRVKLCTFIVIVMSSQVHNKEYLN